MDRHLQVLERLQDNAVSIIRFYTINDTFYFAVSPAIEQKEIERIVQLFFECDYFPSYNLFALNMRHQTFYTSNETVKRPREVFTDKFKLDKPIT